MSEKCDSCGASIEVDELGKFQGTVRKRKAGDKNEKVYYCSSCQKEGKDKM